MKRNEFEKYSLIKRKDEVIGKELDLNQYSNVKGEVTNDEIEIEDVILFDQYEDCMNGFNSMFDFPDIVPVLEVLGGSIIGIGLNKWEGQVLLVDFDFGIFKLDENIDEFINNLY